MALSPVGCQALVEDKFGGQKKPKFEYSRSRASCSQFLGRCRGLALRKEAPWKPPSYPMTKYAVATVEPSQSFGSGLLKGSS